MEGHGAHENHIAIPMGCGCDAAIRRPETVVETKTEVLARDRARQLYDQSNMYGGEQWIDRLRGRMESSKGLLRW
jgi:hypothetical protein